MTYKTVIPRDLFNHASLLKCLGQLYLKTENWLVDPDSIAAISGLSIENRGPGFDIHQDDSDGSISVYNIFFVYMDEEIYLYRPLNSREPWPLWAKPGEDCSLEFEDLRVFDDSGELSAEFLALIGRSAKS